MPCSLSSLPMRATCSARRGDCIRMRCADIFRNVFGSGSGTHARFCSRRSRDVFSVHRADPRHRQPARSAHRRSENARMRKRALLGRSVSTGAAGRHADRPGSLVGLSQGRYRLRPGAATGDAIQSRSRQARDSRMEIPPPSGIRFSAPGVGSVNLNRRDNAAASRMASPAPS